MASEPAETRSSDRSRGDAERSDADAVGRAILAYQSGDDRESSFRWLYRTHHHALVRFFAAKGLPQEECQDLTQETFFRVYKGLEAYEHRERFAAWLYRLAANVFRKRLRASGAAKRTGYEMQVDDSTDALFEDAPPQLDALLHDERRQALRRAVRELPEQMRQCLTLRLYHALSYREIAVVMRIKIDTVKAHLFQARKRLREQLSEGSVDSQDPGDPERA